MTNGFHGRTMGAMSVTANAISHDAFGPILDGLIRVKFNSFEDCKRAIESNADVSAVLLEPIQGEGGIVPCDKEYLQKIRDMY